MEHSVTTDIQASAERVWEVWSDLEAILPRWMRLIESVQKPWRIPDLTDWNPPQPKGFRFHWEARISQRVKSQAAALGIGGRTTHPKGAVRFYPQTRSLTAVRS